MSNLVWATDIHLDHLPPTDWHEFGLQTREKHPDSQGWLLTGDIGDAEKICDILEIIQSAYGGPLYFVLGNHDYYRGSFAKVDKAVRRLCEQISELFWLKDTSAHLDAHTTLVGAGGWYDARYGDPQSDLGMSDFLLIEDLFEAQDESRERLLDVLANRADEHAQALASQLELVAQGRATEVIVATHVPPFREAALHRGEPPNDTWAPFFTSRATADVLLASAKKHPDLMHTVLCGHTHSRCLYQPRENLVVYTGEAQYGAPHTEAVVTFEKSGAVSVDFER